MKDSISRALSSPPMVKSSRASAPAKRPVKHGLTATSSSSSSSSSSRTSGRLTAPVLREARLSKPMFAETDAVAAISTSATRRFEMAGNLFTGVRCRMLEPFMNVVQPHSTTQAVSTGSYPAFLGVVSLNGTTLGTDAFYVTALNPAAMPIYGAFDATQWVTGVAFPDSNVLGLIARAFSRYRVHATAFHYRPTCPTSTEGLLAFGYSEDPSHPLIGISEFSTSAYPSISTIENGSNSIIAAPWCPWSIHLPCDSAPKYLAVDGQYSSGPTTTVVYDAADIRHTNFGSACFLSSLRSTTETPNRVGELYWELDIEFYDPVPTSITAVIPAFLEAGLIGHGMRGIRNYESKILKMRTPPPKEEKKKIEPLWPGESDDSDGEAVLAITDSKEMKVVTEPSADSLFVRPPTPPPGVSVPPPPVPVPLKGRALLLTQGVKLQG